MCLIEYPNCSAYKISSEETDSMPSYDTDRKSKGVLNANAESIEAFCAASVPSTSMVGSDSAKPKS